MKCYHPVRAFRTGDGSVVFSEKARYGDIVSQLELPCGQCIGCRERRASDWALRVMHEASLHDANCFVTLTYGRDSLPPGASLEHADFQKFMKRVRFRLGRPVRFYMCGEYGPLNQRPHYHACLFGVDFGDDRAPAGKSGSGALFFESKLLTELWGHGIATVQDLVPETASYCARYIMKKRLGKDAEVYYGDRKHEYAAMSLKPGIGADWYRKFGASDAHLHDFVVQDGVRRRVPKYYDRLLAREGCDKLLSLVQDRRLELDPALRAENSEDRLRVQEIVHEAKVRTLVRNDL